MVELLNKLLTEEFVNPKIQMQAPMQKDIFFILAAYTQYYSTNLLETFLDKILKTLLLLDFRLCEDNTKKFFLEFIINVVFKTGSD